MGLDVGASGGRCVLLDVESGRTVNTARAWRFRPAGNFGYDLDPAEVWRLLGEAVREAIAKAGPSEIVAVATTGMRHGSVVLGRGDEVLLATPTRDARGAMHGLMLAGERGSEFNARTGHFPAPLFTAARLLWLAEEGFLSRAETVFSLSDWLTYRLSGARVAEPSVASESGLFEIGARRWATDLIESLGLPTKIFPEVANAGTRVGAVSPEAAQHLGIAAGVPVVVGGGDTQCGLVGAGAVEPGQVGLVAGTTLPVQWTVDRPVVDAEARTWSAHHVVADRWVVEANGGLAGELVDWLGRVLYDGFREPAAALLAEASLSTPGAEGIVSTLGAEVFNARRLRPPVGHLTISPLLAADGQACRGHVARAVVEGLVYAARANFEEAKLVVGRDQSRNPERVPNLPRGLREAQPRSANANGKAPAVRLAGGLSRSAFFAQLVADVLALPVEVPETPQGSALGAALCAGVGTGVFHDFSPPALARRRFTPDAERQAAYQSLYQGWNELRRARAEADQLVEAHTVQALTARVAHHTSAAPKTEPFRPKIFVTAALDEDGLKALSRLGEVRYESFRDHLRLLAGDDLVEALAGVHVFITEVDAVDADVLSKAKDLRVVAACRGNAVIVDVDACTAFGIPVLSTPGRNAEAAADLTVSFMLMLARKLVPATQFLRQPGEAGDVGRMGRAFEGLQGRELWRKTIGLVGFGAVGQRVAKRLVAFGARVVAYDPFLRPERAVLADVEAVSLERLLEESDFVSLHATVTDESRALLGPVEIAHMKRGAFLVNTARAALVDEAALVAALRSGHLAGAAVYVFPIEPPAPDHPLLQLPTVIGTPHVGGNTFEVSAHQGALVVADLADLLDGKRPANVANRETLETFSWQGARPVSSPETIERLRQRSRPSVTDLPTDSLAALGATSPPPVPTAAPSPLVHVSPGASSGRALLKGLKNVLIGKKRDPRAEAGVDATQNGHDNGASSARVRTEMERVLNDFCVRVSHDERVLSFAEGRSVTVRYDLPDVGLAFYNSFDKGAVRCGLGDPPEKPQVTLKMKAEILDKLFTSRENGPKAAMSGKLSFTGDTIKAMSLQRIQKDLNRLYSESRAQVVDLDAVFKSADDEAPAPSAASVAPQAAGTPVSHAGDVRDDVVRIVEEMYAAGLITSTGGNVSVRILGKDEVWITPNSSFKGALRPDMLVRIDLEGNPIGDAPFAPSSERMLHCAVYRANPTVGAVIHSHAPKATILGLAGLPFLPISTEAAFIGEIPRVPFIMPGTGELADAVGRAAVDAPAVIMQNHGLIVGGPNLRHAADMTLIIEQTADKLIACHALGKTPPVLPEALVSTLKSLGEMVA
jgi:autoinducer 2 (AI-2) kinase